MRRVNGVMAVYTSGSIDYPEAWVLKLPATLILCMSKLTSGASLFSNVQWETCFSKGFFWLQLPSELYLDTQYSRIAGSLSKTAPRSPLQHLVSPSLPPIPIESRFLAGRRKAKYFRSLFSSSCSSTAPGKEPQSSSKAKILDY